MATAMQATMIVAVFRVSRYAKTVIPAATIPHQSPRRVSKPTQAAIVAAKAGVGPTCANAAGAKRNANPIIAPTQIPRTKRRSILHIS